MLTRERKLNSNSQFHDRNESGTCPLTLNDDIIHIVAAMLEEKTEFVQTYFANPDFQNFVNARVFQAAVSQLSSQRV